MFDRVLNYSEARAAILPRRPVDRFLAKTILRYVPERHYAEPNYCLSLYHHSVYYRTVAHRLLQLGTIVFMFSAFSDMPMGPLGRGAYYHVGTICDPPADKLLIGSGDAFGVTINQSVPHPWYCGSRGFLITSSFSIQG